MAVPVLVTKLFIPPRPPKVVARPRLVEQLNEGLSTGRNITVISAPAGFGKTTLVTEWIASGGRPVAWLSLDEGDKDLTRFLIYIISALRTISPGLGAELLGALQSSQSPPVESILTALLNEVTAIPDDFIFVLDDYHLTDNKAIDNALTFIVEHIPAQMHLVLTTREDPAIPIPRLRARNQLIELRAADLRFTPSEAAEFLNRVMDLGLSEADVDALETRTEGWIAGLQLAALSMKGNRDVTGFVRAFAGDHRYIVDYLVEEVLQRQPESVRNFLLQTSILDRLNGPLCDAVTGQPDSKTRLETLQRRNFFIIPLDDRRHWCRYHHLFADILRMHLNAEQPDQVPVLHRRASVWHEKNGSAPDAIHHALAAKDFDRAADLIERVVPAMRQNRQESMLLHWLKALPDELLQYRPVLSVHYAGTLLQNGQLNGVESRLRNAERWLDIQADVPERPIFVDEADFQRLPALVAMYRAGIALAQGDVSSSTKHASRVLDLAPQDDYFLRGAASAIVGLAAWTNGDLERAHKIYADGMAYLQRTGYISDAIGGCVTLADIRITQGRLRDAMSTYERGLQLATKHGAPPLRGAADMHVGMSELYRERNDLNAATQHLLKSKELGELNGLPKNPHRWRVATVRILEAQGELDGALGLLEEAEQHYEGDFAPNVRPVAALRTRVWITQGRLDEALGWAREQGLSADDDISYLREFEHITLARILLAQSKTDHSERPLRAAIGLLARLLEAALKGGRMGSAIEILVLQALAYQVQEDMPTALTSLERALIAAEPEGYARIFLDEGASIRLLIEDFKLMIESQARGQNTYLIAYADILLDAFARSSSIITVGNQKSKIDHLVEPLSQRELEILRLFKTEMSGPEIARELVVALSTVRTHTKSIYSKLNVNSRRAAVKRAIELGLI